MAVGTANQLAFSIAESSYGTAALITGAKRWPFRGDRPRIVPATIDDVASLTGQYEKGLERVISGLKTEATFEFDFRMDCLAYWLFRTLGTIATSGIGPYTHSISQKQGDADSFTIFWKDANTTVSNVERFPGCKVKELTIKGRAGGELSISVNIVGNGAHSEFGATMVAQNSDPIQPFSNIATAAYGGTITYGANINNTGGTNILTKLREFEFTIANEMNEGEEYAAGSTTLPSLERISTGITGRLAAKWEENALLSGGLLDIIEKSTNKSLFLKLTSGTHSATFAFEKAFFGDPAVSGQRGKLTKPLTFEAMYSAGTAIAWKFEVVNATTSYS